MKTVHFALLRKALQSTHRRMAVTADERETPCLDGLASLALGPASKSLFGLCSGFFEVAERGAPCSIQSLRGSEFEERVALSFGEVILCGFVDTYPVSA